MSRYERERLRAYVSVILLCLAVWATVRWVGMELADRDFRAGLWRIRY